jgi:hypothetical protein
MAIVFVFCPSPLENGKSLWIMPYFVNKINENLLTSRVGPGLRPLRFGLDICKNIP